MDGITLGEDGHARGRRHRLGGSNAATLGVDHLVVGASGGVDRLRDPVTHDVGENLVRPPGPGQTPLQVREHGNGDTHLEAPDCHARLLNARGWGQLRQHQTTVGLPRQGSARMPIPPPRRLGVLPRRTPSNRCGGTRWRQEIYVIPGPQPQPARRLHARPHSGVRPRHRRSRGRRR